MTILQQDLEMVLTISKSCCIMVIMDRLYEALILEHFQKYRQMLFLMGARQVGKTTICESLRSHWDKSFYFNWDDPDDRFLIVKGPRSVGKEAALDQLQEKKTLIIFDELHKYDVWKNFLKGFFDVYSQKTQIIVTGSARLDAFRKCGDSLMGRYFRYRMHPLTVTELVQQAEKTTEELKKPKKIELDLFQSLLCFGGFPEPLTASNKSFYEKWSSHRLDQLFYEDTRDLSQIQSLDLMTVLSEVLRRQVGQLTSYTSLSKKVGKSDQTIRSWIRTLINLYFCFDIKPWSKNVARSILKEPKYYLWDWSLCVEDGARSENFVASHLLKAVHYWSDMGLGSYGLFYLRDKEKREVDFLITKNDMPWILVEVKTSMQKPLSKSLEYFKKHLKVPYAFQVVLDAAYVDQDCFTSDEILKVPAQTFLSQLV